MRASVQSARSIHKTSLRLLPYQDILSSGSHIFTGSMQQHFTKHTISNNNNWQRNNKYLLQYLINTNVFFDNFNIFMPILYRSFLYNILYNIKDEQDWCRDSKDFLFTHKMECICVNSSKTRIKLVVWALVDEIRLTMLLFFHNFPNNFQQNNNDTVIYHTVLS